MEEFDFYPQKPKLVEQTPKSNLSLTIFSIVLFVMTFLLLFNQINFVIYLLLVLLIHEMGHFIMMKHFGYKNVRMLFIPLMGAFVQGTKNRYSQKEGFLVTLAGPVPGILIGTILLLVGNNYELINVVHISWLFLLLNVINLLPLDPLDGGQLFKLFVSDKNELFLMIFSFISSLSIIGLGVWQNSLIIILFGFFMGFRVRALQKRYQMHRDLMDDDVNYATSYKLLSNREFSKIKDVVLQHTPTLRKFIEQVSTDESDPIIASQVNNVLTTPLKKDASLVFRIFVLILWLLSFCAPLILALTIDLRFYIEKI